MEIFKKILKNLLILIGLFFVACIVMLFCMYFFKTTIFGYGWKFENKEIQTSLINETDVIEIQTTSIHVKVSIGNEDKITYQDKITGIVPVKKHDDKSIEIPKSEATVVGSDGKSTIIVTEPNKGITVFNDSTLQVFLRKATVEKINFKLIINSSSSDVSIDLGTGICDLQVISNSKSSITVNSAVDQLNVENQSGKVTLNNSVNNVIMYSKNGTLKLKNEVAGDVFMYGQNAYLEFTTINGTLIYKGYKKTGDIFEDGTATGGKIVGASILNGITIDSKNISFKVDSLSGGCDINAPSSGSVTIGTYISSIGSKKIISGKGNIQINKLDVDAMSISTTNGKVNLNLASAINKGDNNLSVTTTYGDVTIGGKVVENGVTSIYRGVINVVTEKGNSIFKNIECQINARVINNGRGKMVCYFDKIATKSSLETATGKLTVHIKAGNAAFITAYAPNKKSINLSGTNAFAADTLPTAIYGATSFETNPLLTLRCLDSVLEIKEYV